MVFGVVLNRSEFSSKSLVVNTVFPQPEGPAIIILVGVLNVNAARLSMTTHRFQTKNFISTFHSYNRPHVGFDWSAGFK